MSDIDDAVMAVFKEGKVALHDGKVDKFNALVNFKDFYNELHDLLMKEKFVDNLKPGIDTPRPKNKGEGNVLVNDGEFVENKKYMNRNKDMYEKEFTDVDLGDGREIEVRWEAIAPLELSAFDDARVYFKLDVVNRFMPDVEKDVNGKKVKLQGGTWEFRNKIIYSNPIKDKIAKIPILGHWNWTEELYYKKIYAPKVEKDIYTVLTKVKPKIYGLIFKHFSTQGQ